MELLNYGACQRYLPRGVPSYLGSQTSQVSLDGWQVLLLQMFIQLHKHHVLCIRLSDEDLLAQWPGLFSGRDVHPHKLFVNSLFSSTVTRTDLTFSGANIPRNIPGNDAGRQLAPPQ